MKLKNDLKRKVAGWLTMLMLFSCYGEAYAQAGGVVYGQEETEILTEAVEESVDEADESTAGVQDADEYEVSADEVGHSEEETDVTAEEDTEPENEGKDESAAALYEPNEAGGYDIDWQANQSGYISNRLEASWLKADGNPPKYPEDGLVEVYAVEAEDEKGEDGIFCVSVNNPTAGGYILLSGKNGTGPLKIRKLMITANKDRDNIAGARLECVEDPEGKAIPGCEIEIEDSHIYAVEDNADLGIDDFYAQPGHIVIHEGEGGEGYTERNFSWFGCTDYSPIDGFVYGGNTVYRAAGMKMSVSLNDLTLKADKPFKKLWGYVLGDSNATFIAEESTDGQVCLETLERRNSSYYEYVKLVALLDDGTYALVKNEEGGTFNIPKKADSPYANVMNGSITADNKSVRFDRENAAYPGETYSYALIEGRPADSHEEMEAVRALKAEEWKEFKRSDNVINGLESGKLYSIVSRTAQEGRLSEYNFKSFVTDMAVPSEEGSVTADWTVKDEADPSTTYFVKADDKGNLWIIDTPKYGNHNLIISANQSSEILKVNRVYLRSEDDADTSGVDLVKFLAGIKGIEFIGDPVVYQIMSNGTAKGVNYEVRHQNSIQLLMDKNGKYRCQVHWGQHKLSKGDRLYAVHELIEGEDGYEPVIDYDKATLAVKNAVGRLVYAMGPLNSIQVTKDNLMTEERPLDLDPYEDGECYIRFDNGEYGHFGGIQFAVEAGKVSVSDYNTESFTIQLDDAAEKGKAEYYVDTVGDHTAAELKKFDTGLKITADDGKAVITTDVYGKPLIPGETYYVYHKTLGDSANRRFARYNTAPVKVTLGKVKHFKLSLKTDRVYDQGETIKNENIVYVLDEADPGYAEAAGDKELLTDKDIKQLRKRFSPDYKIKKDTGSEWQLLNRGGVGVTLENEDYTLECADGSIPEFIYDEATHDKYIMTVSAGHFRALKPDSPLTVDESLKYYCGQSGEELLKNAFISGLYAESQKITAVGGMALCYGKSLEEGRLSGLFGLAGGERLEDLMPGDSFYVQFGFGNHVSEILKLTALAHPVYAECSVNYFFKQGDKLDKTIELKAGDIRVTDLYGTPYARVLEDEEVFRYTGMVAPVFDGVSQTVKGRQDYSLYLEPAETLPHAGEGGNYILSGSSREGYGVYIAPVYKVTLEGNFKSALVNGVKREAGTSFSVDSAMTERLKYLEGEYSRKKLPALPDMSAKVDLPSEVEASSASFVFKGWKKNGVEIGSGYDSITEDTVYSADTRELVAGFGEGDCALSVELDDSNVYYIGVKHTVETDAIMPAAGSDIGLKVYVGDKLLTENIDYKLSYKRNVDAYILSEHDKTEWNKKAPYILIKFANEYKAFPTVTKYFNIHRLDISVSGNRVMGLGVAGKAVKTKAGADPQKLFKTDLVIAASGVAVNKKFLTFSWPEGVNVDTAEKGCKQLKISGTGNLCGSRMVDVYFVSKVNSKSLNISYSKSRLNTVPFDAGDTFYEYENTIRADISANLATKYSVDAIDELYLYRQKKDYVLPGTKKLTYYAYAIDEENKDIRVFRGSYSYKVDKAEADKIEVVWEKGKEGELSYPYDSKGVTLDVSISYNKVPCDVSTLFKLKYKNNKKAGVTATAYLSVTGGRVYNATAVNKDPRFKKEFKISKADLDKDTLVKSAYIVKSDIFEGDQAKSLKAIKKSASVRLTNRAGTSLKGGSDYLFEKFSIREDGNIDLELVANERSKNYEGRKTVVSINLVETYLPNCSVVKRGGERKLNAADIEKLAEGSMSNEDFAAKYGLQISGKINGRTATLVQKDNFNFVVTYAEAGGSAYIQAVGIDGGLYGGSDVMSKKAISVMVVR